MRNNIISFLNQEFIQCRITTTFPVCVVALCCALRKTNDAYRTEIVECRSDFSANSKQITLYNTDSQVLSNVNSEKEMVARKREE